MLVYSLLFRFRVGWLAAVQFTRRIGVVLLVVGSSLRCCEFAGRFVC
jgi:hypothetical protein